MQRSLRSLSSSVSARLRLQHHQARLLSRPILSGSTYPCSRLLGRPVKVHTQMAIKLHLDARRLILRIPCKSTVSTFSNHPPLLNAPIPDLPNISRPIPLVLLLPATRLSSLILNPWSIVLPGYHLRLLQVIHPLTTMVSRTSTRIILLARDPWHHHRYQNSRLQLQAHCPTAAGYLLPSSIVQPCHQPKGTWMLAQLLVFHRKRLNLLNELQMESTDLSMVLQLIHKSLLALNTINLTIYIKHRFPEPRITRSRVSRLRSNQHLAPSLLPPPDHNSQPRCLLLWCRLLYSRRKLA